MKKTGRSPRTLKSGLPYGNSRITPETVRSFRSAVSRHYKTNKRDLPWRKTSDPYRIFISEIMLQQTQVERVVRTYGEFLAVFPDFFSLSRAPLKKILRVWQGMGYNRRAIALREAAKRVIKDFKGVLPESIEELIALPGIGRATASSTVAFAFNKPSVFIETNIRRVFIHHFFSDKENVRDDEILPLVEKTLDRNNPREWYWALMDYGSMLKKKVPNPNRKSAHYQKQSRFEGSNRQIRGKIVKLAAGGRRLTPSQFVKELGLDPERIRKALSQLEQEGFVRKKGRVYTSG